MLCDDPKPCPPPSIWRDLALAAVGGIGAAVVSEVGQAVRDWLHDRREAARPPRDERKP